MHDKEIDHRNVLVMDLGHLGDIILSLPALMALRGLLSKAKITLLVPSAAQELFSLITVSDDLIAVDRTKLKNGPKLRSIAQIFNLVAEVRRRKFDLVIDLHSLYETNILGFLSGASSRLFANRENRSLDILSNFRPRPPKQDKALHLSSYYLDVLKPLGIGQHDIAVRIDRARFEGVSLNGHMRLLGESDQKQVGLFVGSGHESRRWKLGNFASLAENLAKEINAHVSVFLGPAEQHLEVEVRNSFPSDTSVISGLTLSQLAANLSKIDVLISNDTGPMHLGAIVGTSIVLLLDDRAPRTYLPLTDALEIVGGTDLDQISVEDVLEATLRSVRIEPAMNVAAKSRP